jgi:hypothetical protein
LAPDHQSASSPQVLEGLGDLLGELSGRGQNQCGLIRSKPHQQREAERKGLSGACLGQPDDIPALKDGRDGLSLNQGWDDNALLGQGGADVRRDAQSFKARNLE